MVDSSTRTWGLFIVELAILSFAGEKTNEKYDHTKSCKFTQQ